MEGNHTWNSRAKCYQQERKPANREMSSYDRAPHLSRLCDMGRVYLGLTSIDVSTSVNIGGHASAIHH